MVASTLPKFDITTLHVNTADGSFDLLQVECPRAKCRQAFYVRRAWLRMEDHVVSRACPWCHKWAEIPADLRITPPFKMEGPTNKARRIVRRSKSKRSK